MSVDETGFEKPATNIFKFGKAGDVIKGTLLGSKPFEGEFGSTTSFEVKAIEGFFHNIDDGAVSDKETALVPGEVYTFLGKNTFNDDLLKAKVGQMILVKFVDERKSQKNGKMYKYIEAKLGAMDPEMDPLSAEIDLPDELK